MSINEVEYMALAESTKEDLWLILLDKELGVKQHGVWLHCAN